MFVFEKYAQFEGFHKKKIKYKNFITKIYIQVKYTP